MFLAEFTSCCGASILNDFAWDTDEDVRMGEGGIARMTVEIKSKCRNRGRGMIVAILNNYQIKNGVEEALLGAGFKRMGTRARNYLDRNLQLYMLNVTPLTRPKDQKKPNTRRFK